MSRGARNEIAFRRKTVDGHGYDTFAYTFRIPDSDLIKGSAEAAADGVFLPVRAYARIHEKAVIRRSDSKDILGHGVPVPCSRTRKPAVLGLARTRGILSGDHL